MAHNLNHKVKITVLKREYYQDLADKYLDDPNVGKCDKFHEGQEFIVDMDTYFSMMNNQFCSEAWQAIHKYIYSVLQGGDFMNGWSKSEDEMIVACIDGVRPVIFKLEKLC